jgi:inositol transport system substrate-binding protein
MFLRTGKIASLMVVAAFVATACSGGSSASPSESASASASESASASAGKITLGVAFPNSDTFLSRVQDGMKTKAAELGVDITITDAKDDTATQLSQVENFISQGVSAIIVVPVDTSAAQPMADAAKKANIPLVFVNRNPSIAGVPYVGSDSLYAGTVEMEELAKLAGNKGEIVILQGQVTNEAAVLRTQGCNDVAGKVGMTVVATQAGDWDRAKGQAITENWIQSGTLKEGMVVCANNDEALAAMQAGDLEVTVFQDAKGQGAGGVQAAVDLVNGKTVPDYVDIPYVLVTPANINDYLGAN